jgi:hypothetical protein
VTEQQKKILECEYSINNSKENIKTLNLKNSTLNNQLKEAHERIEESNKIIANNQEVFFYFFIYLFLFFYFLLYHTLK